MEAENTPYDVWDEARAVAVEMRSLERRARDLAQRIVLNPAFAAAPLFVREDAVAAAGDLIKAAYLAVEAAAAIDRSPNAEITISPAEHISGVLTKIPRMGQLRERVAEARKNGREIYEEGQSFVLEAWEPWEGVAEEAENLKGELAEATLAARLVRIKSLTV